MRRLSGTPSHRPRSPCSPRLSTLNRLVIESGLAETLQGPGPCTVFAPERRGIQGPAGSDDATLSDNERLTLHVVPGKVVAADVANGPAKTSQGSNVALASRAPFVTRDEAAVPSADLPATNGVVHIVVLVLLPPR